MNAMIQTGLQTCLHGFLLRGYGWQTRKRVVAGASRREWRDPHSGHWYGARQAMAILNVQIIGHYAEHAPARRSYTLRC